MLTPIESTLKDILEKGQDSNRLSNDLILLMDGATEVQRRIILGVACAYGAIDAVKEGLRRDSSFINRCSSCSFHHLPNLLSLPYLPQAWHTPLMIACRVENHQLIDLLLEHSELDINIVPPESHFNLSALGETCRNWLRLGEIFSREKDSNYHIACKLVKAGADPWVGSPALPLVLSIFHRPMLEVFLENKDFSMLTAEQLELVDESVNDYLEEFFERNVQLSNPQKNPEQDLEFLLEKSLPLSSNLLICLEQHLPHFIPERTKSLLKEKLPTSDMTPKVLRL